MSSAGLSASPPTHPAGIPDWVAKGLNLGCPVAASRGALTGRSRGWGAGILPPVGLLSHGAGDGERGWGLFGCTPGCHGAGSPADGISPLFPTGPVRLHREHSHHRREGDPAALQRHHQAGHSEETARGRAALPQGPQPARRLDRGVQNPLPRQNSSPDETDPQAAPPVLLEPRGLFSKQQYSKRTCHSIRPTRSRGARALSNAKNPLSFPRSPHPSLPPLPLSACFLLQQRGNGERRLLPSQLSSLPAFCFVFLFFF